MLQSRARTGSNAPSRVRVAVRVRPTDTTKTNAAKLPPPLCLTEDVEGNESPVVHFRHETIHKSFAFDHVFSGSATQEDVYTSSLRPFMVSFLNGFNVTVIAYGQTGAGKTYTVGNRAIISPCPSPETGRSSDKNRLTGPEDGLIPRFLIDLFDRMRAEPSVRSIHVSFLEIYCDEIHDLLGPRGSASKERSLIIRDDEHRVTVENLQQVQVETVEKALELLSLGRARQAVGSNALNDQSSRSHAIYTIEVCRKFAHDIKNAKLTFVDLAGSERLAKTHVQGMRMKESIQINVGLLALGNVINALGDDRLQKRRRSIESSGLNGDTVSFVPYRSSKLTRLLRDALGGNSMSLFIACVSPETSNSGETLSTLQYANRARNIQNKAQKNVENLSSGNTTPQSTGSPRSNASSPRHLGGRTASEVEISRLHEQILILKHQLDMATSSTDDKPVQCTTYETPSASSKEVVPRRRSSVSLLESRIPKSTISRGPEVVPAGGDTTPKAESTPKPEVDTDTMTPDKVDEGATTPSENEQETTSTVSMLPQPRIYSNSLKRASFPSLSPAPASTTPRGSIALKLFLSKINPSLPNSPDQPEQQPSDEIATSPTNIDEASRADQENAESHTDESPKESEHAVEIEPLAKEPSQPSLQPPQSGVELSTQGPSLPAPAAPTTACNGALRLFLDTMKLPNHPRVITQELPSPSSSSSSASTVSPTATQPEPAPTATPSALKLFLDKFKTPSQQIEHGKGNKGMDLGGEEAENQSSQTSEAHSAYARDIVANVMFGANARQCSIYDDIGSPNRTTLESPFDDRKASPLKVERNFRPTSTPSPERFDATDPAENLEHIGEPQDANNETPEQSSRMVESQQLSQMSDPEESYTEQPQSGAHDAALCSSVSPLPKPQPSGSIDSQPASLDVLIRDAQNGILSHQLNNLTGMDDVEVSPNDDTPSSLKDAAIIVRSDNNDELIEDEIQLTDASTDDSPRQNENETPPTISLSELSVNSQQPVKNHELTSIPTPGVTSIQLKLADNEDVSPLASLKRSSRLLVGYLAANSTPHLLPATIDTATQYEAPTTTSVAVAATKDYVVDAKRWRDTVRHHFRGPGQQQRNAAHRRNLRKSRPHPMKLFALSDNNDHDNAQPSLSETLSNTSEQLRHTLEELRQIVSDELNSNHSSIATEQGMTIETLLSQVTDLLDQRLSCKSRVDAVKHEVRELARCLEVTPVADQPDVPLITVELDDEMLRHHTLGYQETLLRAALERLESLAAERLLRRLQHHEEAAGISPVGPDVFLSVDQFAACQVWCEHLNDHAFFRAHLLPLVVTGWISVTEADLDQERAWLDL